MIGSQGGRRNKVGLQSRVLNARSNLPEIPCAAQLTNDQSKSSAVAAYIRTVRVSSSLDSTQRLEYSPLNKYLRLGGSPEGLLLPLFLETDPYS